MTKEKLIERIIKECEKDGEPVTKEEAAEMAEMEIKASSIKRYEKNLDKKRQPSKRERKVDETKKRLLDNVRVLLEGLNADILNIKTETEIMFSFQNEEYSFKLVKHRKKK